VFPGVGRVVRAYGTPDAKTRKRIDAMLSGLKNIGKLDVLKWIRDGHHTPLVVLHHWERGQIEKLKGPEAISDLVTAFTHYVETHECSDSHRANLHVSRRRLERLLAKRKDVPLSEIPSILRTAKDGMRTTPVAFNRFRGNLLAFVSEVEGKMTPLWVAVSNVNRFKKAEGQRPRKLIRRPLTVAELDAVCAAFEDVTVFGGRKGGANKGVKTVKRTIRASDLRAMAWTLATTGMRPQEFWQRKKAGWSTIALTRSQLYVAIDGTKTAAARRPSFAIGVPQRAVCGEQFFRAQLALATEKALRVGLDLYSLRRTFAALMESAGIEASRRASYLGHGPKTVTDLYTKTVVLPFVHQDAERVANWIERERAAARPTLKLEATR
jgi:hypothetical protein